MVPVSYIQIEADLSSTPVEKKSTTLSSSLSINTLISLGFIVDILSIATEGQLSQSGFNPLSFALGGYGNREIFGQESIDIVKRNSIKVSEVSIDVDQTNDLIIDKKSVKVYTSETIDQLTSIPTLIRNRVKVSSVVIEV